MAGESQSDEKLMLAYQQGDERAFGILYARHSGRVYGYLMSRLRDPEWAGDVFQATFMKLHSSRSRYDSGLPFLPWLFTICRSVLIDSVRARKRVLEDFDPEALDRAPAAAVEEPPESPDLSQLPRAQRTALELRYGEDLEFDEIARKLDTSPANVRQLVSRALRRLRLLGKAPGCIE